MAEEVYIELEELLVDNKYRVDLAPVNTVEETGVKETYDSVLESDQDEGLDPTNIVTDMKNIIHSFTLTGDITATPDDIPSMTLSEKKARLRILLGLTGNATNTRLKFHYEDDDYHVFMKRLTFTQGAGETRFDYIIELKEGIRYQDW